MVRPPTARNRRRVVIAGVAVVVLLGGAGAAWAETRSSGPQWRLAMVSTGDVTDTLVATGVLAPAEDTELNFAVAGTVRRVYVKQGEHVHAGELVAKLKPGTLRAAVSTAKKTLTQAREQLSSDESSESSSTTTSSTTSAADTSTRSTDTSATTSAATIGAEVVEVSKTSKHKGPGGAPTGTSGTGSSPGTAGADKALAVAQQAVVQAQHLTDQDLATAKTDLASEDTICAQTSTTTTTTSPSACETAAATELTDEQTVSSDEAAVLTTENTLAAVIASAEKSLANAQKSAASSSAGTKTTTPTTGSSSAVTTGRSKTSATSSTSGTSRTGSYSGGTSTTGGGGQTTTVTAATLAHDEANIDSAEATVTTARADLAEATLRSAVSGTVKLISISRGDNASGSAGTTPQLEIAGSKQDTATLYVTAEQVRELKVGMKASVVPDGDTGVVSATVTQIGAVEETSASDTTGYPVTITLADTKESLVSGGDASVTISLGTVRNVLSVPTSTVHRNGTTFYLLQVNGNTSKKVTVRVGASGAVRTQILSGVAAGQGVILANLNEAVPSSNESTTTSFRSGSSGGFSGGGGGFSGGGGPPGAGR